MDEAQNQGRQKPKISDRMRDFLKLYGFLTGIIFGIATPILTKYYDKVIAAGVSPESWTLSVTSLTTAIIVGGLLGVLIVVRYNKTHGVPIECGKIIDCATHHVHAANGLVDRLREIKDSEIRALISNQIIDDDSLEQLEKKANNGSKIYVITSNFKWEDRPNAFNLIIDNLVQGVEYRYIIPRDENRDFFENMVRNIFLKFKETLISEGNKSETIREMFLRQFTAVSVDKKFVFLTTVLYKFTDTEKEVIVKLPYEGEIPPNRNEKYVYKIPRTPAVAWNTLLEKVHDLYHNIMHPAGGEKSDIGEKVDIAHILNSVIIQVVINRQNGGENND